MQGIITTPMSSLSHSHRRKSSGELDVFAATKYFSDVAGVDHDIGSLQTKSLQYYMPIEAHVRVNESINNHTKEKIMKFKLKQQPSSPGAKLASYVNSLFQQYYSASKKKIKPSKSLKGHDQEGSVERRKRRNGMRNDVYPKSCYYSSSCTSSGFTTPSLASKKRDDDWLDAAKRATCDKKFNLKKEEKGGFKEEADDGEESDSSSDLFELKNYHEFEAEFSCGLPVYGSTNIGVIRKGAGVVNI